MTEESKHLVAFVCGTALVLIILVMTTLFVKDPTPFQYYVFRIALSLAAAAFSIYIPGILDVKFGYIIRGTGAIGVFLIVYFLNPGVILEKMHGSWSSDPKPSGSQSFSTVGNGAPTNVPSDIRTAALPGLPHADDVIAHAQSMGKAIWNDDVWKIYRCSAEGEDILCDMIITIGQGTNKEFKQDVQNFPCNLTDDQRIDHPAVDEYLINGRNEHQDLMHVTKGDIIWFEAKFENATEDIKSVRVACGRKGANTNDYPISTWINLDH